MPQSILVVEDNEHLARPLVRLLKRQGYEVTHVASCRAARATVGKYDLAVLDLDLPDGSGIDLHAELMRTQRTSSVVFYTGTVDEALVRKACELGPCVRKSEGVRPLLDCIHAVLECQIRWASGPGSPGSA